MNPRFHTLKIKDIRRETNDAVSFSIEIPSELKADFHYKPGQHLTFKRILNDVDVRRSYSICSAEYENELRVAVKKIPNGKFSSFVNDQLAVGDEIEVMNPMGNFTTEINANTTKNFVFFAGGSGITPIMALTKTILHTAKNSTVSLIYGNRGFSHIIFREEIDALKNMYMDRLSVMHIFSDEKIGNELQEGLLNKEKVTELYNAILEGDQVDEVFVCGPQPMIMAVKEVFEEKGMNHHQIHFELFTNPDQEAKEAAQHPTAAQHIGERVTAQVSAIIDGEMMTVELSTDGKSILDAVNDAGGDAPYSCKGGVCSTCKAKVLEGKVFMDKNYALEEDEVEAGYILTCQSHPLTEKVTVSYDEW
ncbi:MAG: phenylacetate-CoA oxygenase/reductase subunit PaaK [Brumimicrobium sp.]|nr:phenylacetate-CoA oxygenase/reductase subunit PaaK [Brumimicrobium sp.]